jgi:hypothetical protein
MTLICAADCWAQFQNEAAYASANYGHFCIALLKFFFGFTYVFHKTFREKN